MQFQKIKFKIKTIAKCTHLFVISNLLLVSLPVFYQNTFLKCNEINKLKCTTLLHSLAFDKGRNNLYHYLHPSFTYQTLETSIPPSKSVGH